MPHSAPMMSREYIDVPKVEPTIKKQRFVPMMSGGRPKPHEHEKIAAMAPQYKCVDCGGFRVFGVGNPRKAAVGFVNQKFFFCSACAKWLQKEEQKKDLAKMDDEMRAAAEAALEAAVAK